MTDKWKNRISAWKIDESVDNKKKFSGFYPEVIVRARRVRSLEKLL